MDCERLSPGLKERGFGWPLLLIDEQALDANLEKLLRALNGRPLRLVLKSLPCTALIDRALARAGAQRLMVFDVGMLLQAVQRWPQADLLMGKPLPMAAVELFFRDLPSSCAFDPARQLHWLVDHPERAAELAAFAGGKGLTMSVAVELDIGMRRGGAAGPHELAAVLEVIRSSDGRLRLQGFMGYDAHAGKAVPWRGQQSSVGLANQRYRALLDLARRDFTELLPPGLMINGAGSPTFMFHDQRSPLNDFAVGSVLLKPAEFDLPQLSAYRPALWIAAPVIKRQRGVRIPHLEALSVFSRRDALFIYGGRWPAQPCWPKGLRASLLYGPSFNQQLLSVPRQSKVGEGEFVFFRPLQSERVMQQFPEALILGDEQPDERWPVMAQAPLRAGL